MRIVAGLLGLFAFTFASAETPVLGVDLVKDINTAVAPASSQPFTFFVDGGKTYFSATTAATGRELFVSDGTAAGTRLLSDVMPGLSSSYSIPLGIANGHLIVNAGEFTDRRIWSVPLGGGPAQAITTESRPAGEPETWTRAFASTGTRQLFHYGGDEFVWSTDGTVAGTGRLPVTAQFPVNYLYSGCSGAGEAVVVGADGALDARIIATDGTAAGSRVLATVPWGSGAQALRVGNLCYLLIRVSGSGWALWASDGSAAGSVRVAGNTAHPRGLAALGGNVYVSEQSFDQASARLLRVSAADPVPVPVAEMTGSSSYFYGMQDIGGRLVFVHHAAGDYRLFRSDGTSAGTQQVLPVPPATPWRGAPQLFPLGGAVLVTSYGGTLPLRLDLTTGVASTGLDPDKFSLPNSVRLGDVRIGLGYEPASGEELWLTDGTANGSRLLKDLWAPTADGLAFAQDDSWAVLGDVLVFTNGLQGSPLSSEYRSLWRSDGTDAGTYALPRAAYDKGGTWSVARYDDKVLFSSVPSFGNSALYSTDAALRSATRVAGGFTTGGVLQEFAQRDKVLFDCSGLLAETTLCRFSAADGVVAAAPGRVDFAYFLPIASIGSVALLQPERDSGIWRSNGTVPGTFLVSTRRYAGFGGQATFGGKVYFSSCEAGQCALTVSDGTVAGTAAFIDLAGRELRAITALPDRLVFATSSSAGGADLWSSDGTLAGTQQLGDFDLPSPWRMAVVGGKAHMAVTCDGCGSGYVVSDGTFAGTHMRTLPDGLRASQSVMTAAGEDLVVFACVSPARGEELCAADGSGENARALPEIVPGDGSAGLMAAVGVTPRGVFVAADDTIHGRELWFVRKVTDAIFAGTFETP